MRKIVNLILIVLCGLTGFAQTNFEGFLNDIQKNNSTLKTYQSQAKAQKLENKVGLSPTDPTVEGAYLWGSPTGIGNRKDFSVTQEIDFPTVYIHQRKLAAIRDGQADVEYEFKQLEILQKAADFWVEAVCFNRKELELKGRLEQAQKLAKAYDEKLAVGDANLIDLNKANLYRLQTEKELEQLNSKRQQLSLQLAAISGEQVTTVAETTFLPVQLPDNLNLWLEQMVAIYPEARWYGLEQLAGEQALKVSKGKTLPRINGGYLMENTVAEKFQGITVGLSVPLWEQKNTVRAARVRQEAMALQQQDFQLQWRSLLTQLYRETESAQKLVLSYREQLNGIQQKELLDEALQAGQISLVEYLLELQFNYNAIDQLMEAERELQLAYVKMKVLEL